MKKPLLLIFCAAILAGCNSDKIDREALVTRNNPYVDSVNPLHSLNVGNGAFTATLDATGLQTFPEYYKDGLSLGTYSEWAWHSFHNVEGYTHEETLENHPLPGHPEGIYSVQVGYGQDARSQAAADWVRANPHRLHLGNFGFAGMKVEDITEVSQTLDMWNGVLNSEFKFRGTPVQVQTVSAGDQDLIAASINSQELIPVTFRFPYPTGGHTDDGSDWNSADKHSTEIISLGEGNAVIKRNIDESEYFVNLSWVNATLEQSEEHILTLTPAEESWNFSIAYTPEAPVAAAVGFKQAAASGKKMWNEYWNTSGVIDFSHCTNEAAPLLEKRVVLSQYLMRVQEAQSYPPAETGMTYNSWYGKFHLEMVMWHSFHYATWGKADLLEKQLQWFKSVMPEARKIAERQGFSGVRWMKMTDPTALEAPSDIGSFIIWQQPHPIYMAELIYRDNPSDEVIEEYYDMVQQTAAFMGEFVSYDSDKDRYFIEGACAASESLNENSTINPSLELSYWHFGLKVAQEWRERKGEPRDEKWDDILNKLSPLALSPDGIYMSAEKGPGVPNFEDRTIEIELGHAPAGGYVNAQRSKTVVVSFDDLPEGRNPEYIRGTSNENLLAFGMLPECRLFTLENMQKTAIRASENYNWDGGSWSWNYPTFAMNATRCGLSDIAVKAITMNNRDDLLLPSGNNYRSTTLRMYLPGNGGLLMAVGMMCAGWDGCTEENPGFPKDGTWDVRWEGLQPLP